MGDDGPFYGVRADPAEGDGAYGVGATGHGAYGNGPIGDGEPRVEYRRRVPRQKTGWPGRCRVEDVAGEIWVDCQVADISVIGAGLVIADRLPSGLVGRRLAVEVSAPGGSVSVRLVGEVRNVSALPDGATRAGIEFEGLSVTERSILDALEFMKVAW